VRKVRNLLFREEKRRDGRAWPAVIGFFLLLGQPHPLFARTEYSFHNTFGGTWNPRGLQNTFDFSIAHPLYSSGHPLLSRGRASLGVSSVVSPSYQGLSGWLELAPLSILEIRVGAERIDYFGAVGSLLPYEGYGENFDENARDDRWDDAVARGGRRLYVSPSLKFEAGRWSGWGNAEWEWWKVHSPRPFFYEPRRDTLLKRNDHLVRTTFAALYKIRQRLRAGPIYQETRIPQALRNRVRRLGLLALWSLPDRWAGLRNPELIVTLSGYSDDPYRTGEPYAALALRFGGTEKKL
jgi:hypothetical protein